MTARPPLPGLPNRFSGSSAGGIPLVPTQASILSHSSAPSTPQTGHIGKESENAAGEKVDTFGGKQCDPLQLPQRVPLLEEGKRQQNPSVLNQRFRDAALMGQLAVFLFLWLFFAVFLTHGRKQASNPAPLGRIWNTLVYLLAGTASAVELKVFQILPSGAGLDRKSTRLNSSH